MFFYKILNAAIEELKMHVGYYTIKYFQMIWKYVDDTLSQSNNFSPS